MFIDDRGNEFETEKEMEDFARKDFYNQEEYWLAEGIEDYVSTIEILKWILKNDKEKFMKDYEKIFKNAEDDYATDYFFIHNVEERED